MFRHYSVDSYCAVTFVSQEEILTMATHLFHKRNVLSFLICSVIWMWDVEEYSKNQKKHAGIYK